MKHQPGSQYHHCVHSGVPTGTGEKGEDFQARQASKLPNIFIWGDVWKYLLVSVIFAPIFCRRLKPCTCLGLVSNHPTDITLLSIIAARDLAAMAPWGLARLKDKAGTAAHLRPGRTVLGMGGCGRCPQAISHASLSPWEAIRSSFSSPAG